MLQLLVVLSPQVVVAAMRVVVILLRSAAISQIALVPRRNNAPAKMAVVEKKPVIVLAMPSAVPVRSVPARAVRKRQPVNKQKAVANCPSAVRNMKLAAMRRPTAAPSRNLAARMIPKLPTSARAVTTAARAVSVIRVVRVESPVAMATRLAADRKSN